MDKVKKEKIIGIVSEYFQDLKTKIDTRPEAINFNVVAFSIRVDDWKVVLEIRNWSSTIDVHKTLDIENDVLFHINLIMWPHNLWVFDSGYKVNRIVKLADLNQSASLANELVSELETKMEDR